MSNNYSTHITIDNLVLLNILQKYKDLGLFGNNNPIFNIGEGRGSNPYQTDDGTQTPAFEYLEDNDSIARFDIEWPICPKDLNQVIPNLITFIKTGTTWNGKGGTKLVDPDLFVELKTELLLNEQDIERSFISVVWVLEYESIQLWHFSYDKINGEKYHEEWNDGEEETEDE